MNHLLPFRPAAALRASFRDGYTLRDLRSDVLAGIVVGIIALPLSMALAIAVGVPPEYGLYTAIVAGAVIAVLGGSRVQVSGPTAAFVVILAPITAQFGLAGLAVATVLAGIIQIVFALAGLGRLIQFVPYPVTIGFTAGIATVIALLQLEDLLGLTVTAMPEHTIPRAWALLAALPTARPGDVAVGAVTLALLILWPKWSKRVPAPLVALLVAALLAIALEHLFSGVDVATIRDRFGSAAAPAGVPQRPPMPGLPFDFHAPGEQPLALSWNLVQELALAAFAIAMLGAIESLLSAVIADGMTGHEHDANGELLGQGIGNVVAPFFGGFAATGAIARTAANIRFGARSPISAVVHAGFILVSVLALAPLLGYLPMAGLAALLMRVAWNMAEARHFVHAVRVSPRSDAVVQLVCFGLTVSLDMVIAVSAGVVLSAVLFMRRMAEVADVRLITERHHALQDDLPPGVLVYEIGGPVFFGAAQKAMSALRTIRPEITTVILDLRSVPVMDATGLVNLDSAIERLAKRGVTVLLAGVQPQPMRVISRGNLAGRYAGLTICATFEEAVAKTRDAGTAPDSKI